jgi:hypothetical protein
MTNNKYHTVGTVPKSKRHSIPLTPKYMTAHFPGLVQAPYTFSLYENPSFINFSAETEYISTRLHKGSVLSIELFVAN